MNVKLAANVFSDTVSKALAYLGTNNYIDTLNWKDASILKIFIIQLIQLTHLFLLKKGFGIDFFI